MRRSGDGKINHERRSREWLILKLPMSHERHIPIPPQVAKYPHEWVTKFTTSGEATSGEFCYPQVGIFCHEWWNWNVPWVTNRWFYPSRLLLMMWLTFLYSESENVLISPVDFKKTHQIAIVIGNLLAVHDWQSRTASIYASCTWLSITYSKRTMIYMLAVRDWQSCTANVLWFIC